MPVWSAKRVRPVLRYTCIENPAALAAHPSGAVVCGLCRFAVSERTLISSEYSGENPIRRWLCAVLLGVAVSAPGGLAAQSLPGLPASQSSAADASSFQGSVATGEVSAQPIDLSLDEAIQRGLKTNLGVILSGAQTAAARGERLSQLQSLLPSVDASAKETVMQVDLPAEGLRIPGFPTIIGPFGFTDLRASLSWSLVDVASLRNYLAARHNFAAAQLLRRGRARTGGAHRGQCLSAGAGR